MSCVRLILSHCLSIMIPITNMLLRWHILNSRWNKKLEGEIYKDFMPDSSDDEIKEIKDIYAFLFKNLKFAIKSHLQRFLTQKCTYRDTK